jgi:hypothetical protein
VRRASFEGGPDSRLAALRGRANWCDPAFAGLFAEDEKFAHVMDRARVYKVSIARCLPD